jgi:pyruvate dehydrogenase E2 component (dihydrolipoamide acetyltransferase)
MSTTTITIPELGEGVDTVDVVSVLVNKGDRIEVDQPLIEVETEKAAVEVPATAAGTITEIHVEEGQSLGPDAPIVTIETDDAETQPTPATDDNDDEPEELTEVAEIDAGPDETQPIAVAGDGGSGRDRDRDSDSGGDKVSDSDSDSGSGKEQQLIAEIQNSKFKIENSPARLVPAAPTVRRFAREVGMDITQVEGSGPGGRISIDDVKAAVNRKLSRASAGTVGVPTAELPDFSRWGTIRREPMSKIRTLTAEAMSRAWLTAPQVTNHELADVTELEELRHAYKSRVESAGGKLTMTAILIKVAATALKRFPDLNASIDPAGGEIIYKDYVNIGVAVDTDNGLLVPVIKNADRKNITEIAVELDDLAARARTRKLKPDEMQGGTFSISNLGGIGGTGFSPIVNWPEVAILGVSRSRVQPEWDDEIEDFEPRRMLPLSLSYDHRLVDGAEAARFLAWFTEALESPLLMALEG